MAAAPDFDTGPLEFSTALRGLNKDEVMAYIAHLNAKLEASVRGESEWEMAEPVEIGTGEPAPTIEPGLAGVLDSEAGILDRARQNEPSQERVRRTIARAEAAVAERLMSKAAEEVGELGERRRQVEKRDEELNAASQRLRDRKRALDDAAAELEQARSAFGMQRTDLLRQAWEEGYSVGVAEAQTQTAAGMAMLADVNADLEAIGEEPLEVAELIHYEIVSEPEGGLEADQEASEIAAAELIEKIKGIGRVYGSRLAEIGVTTCEQLGDADPLVIARAVRAGAPIVESWISQARQNSVVDPTDERGPVAADAIAEGVRADDPRHEANHIEEESPLGGRLRILGNGELDANDVSKTLAILRSAWTADELRSSD